MSLKARTPMLASLTKAFRLAVLSSKKGIRVDEVAEYDESRRRFIRQAAIGAVGVQLIPSALYSSINKPAPKIAIVGAGMSGLNCAYKLKKAGIQSTIFEASGRIGGRMYSTKDIMAPGLVTELGGEFIDSSHKDMLDLIDEFGFTKIDAQDLTLEGYTKEAFFFSGRHYTVNDIIAEFIPFAVAIQKDIDSLDEDFGYKNPKSIQQLDTLSISDYLKKKGITGWLYNLLAVAYLTEYGMEIDKQSCINFLFVFSADTSEGDFNIFGDSDERFKVLGGNQKVTDALAAKVQDQIITNSVLTEIHTKKNTYKLLFTQGAKTKEYSFDIVVMTVPFTKLREVKMNIPLSKPKKQAIAELGYGTGSKLMVGTKTRHWNTLGYQGYTFTDQPMQMGWDNSLLQPGTEGGFTIFTGGDTGNSIGSGTAQSQLDKFLPGLNAIYPGMQQQLNGNVSRFHWPGQQWALGCYAAYKVGQWKAFAGAEGEREGNMFFCGEHTSRNFQGFMNGAAETGRVTAEEIIKQLS